MKKLKVIAINSDTIVFDNNIELSSDHDQDCCEHHELTMSDLTLDDFIGLEFDLSNDNFFKKIEDFGIELIPIKGHSIKIPGHGYNNGYYGDNIDLIISKNNVVIKRYDISECQTIGE